MQGAPATRPALLLCRSDAVDRAVLQADLVRLGYDVVSVGDAPGGVAAIGEAAVEVIVTDLELPGGGGFSVCRKANEGGRAAVSIGLAGRPVDAEVRRIGGGCGVVEFLEHPVSARQVHAAIELARAGDTRRLVPGVDGVVRGDLAIWPLADVVRWIEAQRLTARLDVDRGGALHFREGALTFAEHRALAGEPAFQRMLLWREGMFAIRIEAEGAVTVRPPRNIYRSAHDVLIDGLAAAVERERLIQALPAGPHELRLGRSAGVDGAFGSALSEKRTLMEAAVAAGLDDLAGLRHIAELVRDGAVVPAGAIVRRKPDSEPPTITEALPRRTARIAWAAAIALAVAIVAIWAATR